MNVKSLPVMTSRTRGDCENGPRPCVQLRCRHHLFVDHITAGGDIVSTHARVEDMTETCSLDVAARGKLDLHDVGTLVGVTGERVRQVEQIALRKLGRVLDADMLLDFSHGGEAVPDAAYVDAPFQREVTSAYLRLVPPHERASWRGKRPS